jgi:pyroglutamyl-peptidase
MKILLTGFEPFGQLRINPSQAIIQAVRARSVLLYPDQVSTEILPTAFEAAGNRIRELIDTLKPSAVILLGASTEDTVIRLERVALNLNDSVLPDNAGRAPINQMIVPNGPVAYWSTLPLELLKRELQKRSIPVMISNNAGTYVCNHVFYVGSHQIEQNGIKTICGFIHLPLMTEQTKSMKIGIQGLPFSTMLEAVECCIDVIRKYISINQQDYKS